MPPEPHSEVAGVPGSHVSLMSSSTRGVGVVVCPDLTQSAMSNSVNFSLCLSFKFVNSMWSESDQWPDSDHCHSVCLFHGMVE